MCLAVYKPAKCHIEKRKLRRGFAANPDGAGFMFAANNELHIQKGFFSFRAFYKTYREYESRNPDSDFVIHFRIATSGKVVRDNCHPIKIDKNTAFVHNGILNNSMTMPKNSILSDTQLFVHQILRQLPSEWYKQHHFNELIENYAQNNNSKFILMSNTGGIKIFNEQAGHWNNDIWYSNDSYKPVENKFGFDRPLYENDNFVVCQGCFRYIPVLECFQDKDTKLYFCSGCMEFQNCGVYNDRTSNEKSKN